MNNKIILFLLLLMLSVHPGYSKWAVESGADYRLSSTYAPNGFVAIGALHGSKAELIYVEDDDAEDAWWTITEERSGHYSFRNKKTGDYITFDSVRSPNHIYVGLTETLRGDSSLWLLDEVAGRLVIKSAASPSYQLYLQTGTRYIGTWAANITHTSSAFVFELMGRDHQVVQTYEVFYRDVRNYLPGLSFDGVRPVMDQSSGALLLPVSESLLYADVVRLTADYDDKGGKYCLWIEDEEVAAHEDVSLRNTGKGIHATMYVKRGIDTLAQTQLLLTFMPVVEITADGLNTTQFKQGSFRITDADFRENNDSLFVATFRYRGATASRKIKKAYAVKLKEKGDATTKLNRSMHGLRSDNSWILDAMAVDPGRMRNPSSFTLWNKSMRPPYYYNEETDTVKASRCFFVEVVLNGAYVGIYNMMEKQDRKQFNLKKPKEKNGVTAVRGVLYKGTAWGDGTQMKFNTPPDAPDNQHDSWAGFEVKYPSLDDAQPIDWGPIYKAVGFVSNTWGTKFGEQLDQYFDVVQLVDYFLFIDLIQGYDNLGKNMYFFAPNVQESSKLCVAPWDMDGTWGRQWNGNINSENDPAFNADSWFTSTTRLYTKLLSLYQDWGPSTRERYAELRHQAWSKESILSIFNHNFDLFGRSGADMREYNRWNNSDGIALAFATERLYLQRWIRARLEALDKKYGYDGTGIETLSYKEHINISSGAGELRVEVAESRDIMIYDVSGRMVLRQHLPIGVTSIPLSKGIYVVAGRKVAVR